LVNKEGIPEKAKEIFNELRFMFNSFYDQSGSVGRRYARQDEIGTPFCITVDFDTLKDGTVTIRNRDDASQKRVPAKELPMILNKLINCGIRFDTI
jgi:glycyl-tRNA synthetase